MKPNKYRQTLFMVLKPGPNMFLFTIQHTLHNLNILFYGLEMTYKRKNT
jgi:hypothetical protein